MKNSNTFFLFILIMFIVLIVTLIMKDINRDDARLKDVQIDSLKAEIKVLTIEPPAGFIMVGDTLLQVMTADPERFLHKKHLSQGENFYDFTMNDHQRVEIWIFNY